MLPCSDALFVVQPRMWRITVAVAGLLCFSTNISAQPNKKLYELQERCGKRAAEVFTLEYSSVADSKDGQTLFNYENHCSARLNKCFFLEIAVSYEKEKSTNSKIMRLFDLNDNREYGTFVSGPTESTHLRMWYEEKAVSLRVNGGNL